MRLTILGSAAAEGFPALWCECPVCAAATARGGRDWRCRTSYLIDDDTLVDFGPDIVQQARQFKLDLLKLRNLVVTHAHSDHINPRDLGWRRQPWFSQVSSRIRLFGSFAALRQILKLICEDEAAYSFDQLLIDPVELEPGKTRWTDDLELLPLAADHAPGKQPLIYVIGRGSKRLLLANDTGFPSQETLSALRKLRLDAVVADSTMGTRQPDCACGHMGVNTVVRLRRELLDAGAITPDTPFVANHFSHNGGALHQELEAAYLPHGIAVGYDGMTLEL